MPLIGKSSSIGTLEKVIAALPLPKMIKKIKKKKKDAGDEDPPSPQTAGLEKKKKIVLKAKKSNIPEMPAMVYGQPQTVTQAIDKTNNWNHNHAISRKLSAGILTTVTHEQRGKVFEKMNLIGRKSSITP